MGGQTQDVLAALQFGARADAYLTSAVHAEGGDLEKLAALVRERPGCRVLDLGTGAGHVAYAAAAAGGDVIAADVSAEMLAIVAREAKARGLVIDTRQAPAEALPFADASFDVVLSRYSAHHWRDFTAGLREAARVLRRHGVAGFADVVSPGAAALDTHLQSVEVLRDTSHVRNRSIAEWQAGAADAALVPVTMTTARLRMAFATWVERSGTPQVRIAAIRALQESASGTVSQHFAIEPDGSFTLDTAIMVFRPV